MHAARRLPSPTYHRHEPEKTLLYHYQVVAGHLETFIEQTRQYRGGLPAYVERELRRFLDCGILARGFARFRCEGCGDSQMITARRT